MRTGADRLAVQAAGHTCALPASGAVGLADVVCAAALVEPTAVLGWRGLLRSWELHMRGVVSGAPAILHPRVLVASFLSRTAAAWNIGQREQTRQTDAIKNASILSKLVIGHGRCVVSSGP